MTFDELFQIGEAAHKAHMKQPSGSWQGADRARTNAIVEALRDEIDIAIEAAGAWAERDAAEWFSEILASDGVKSEAANEQ
jgi:L-alanine-DL-glutamate epimerase-like enolase superfamily enzyme